MSDEETVEVTREQLNEALEELWEIIGPKEAINPDWEDDQAIEAAEKCAKLLVKGDEVSIKTVDTLKGLGIKIPGGVEIEVKTKEDKEVATKKKGTEKVEEKRVTKSEVKSKAEVKVESKTKAEAKPKVLGENPHRPGSMRAIAWQSLKEGKTHEETVKIMVKKNPDTSEKNAKRTLNETIAFGI